MYMDVCVSFLDARCANSKAEKAKLPDQHFELYTLQPDALTVPGPPHHHLCCRSKTCTHTHKNIFASKNTNDNDQSGICPPEDPPSLFVSDGAGVRADCGGHPHQEVGSLFVSQPVGGSGTARSPKEMQAEEQWKMHINTVLL